jgi:phytoene dehydrogenase-like protein
MAAHADADVIVVGAGLAGLACACRVAAAGLRPLVLEASDGVGGRLRSDLVDGYRLDRGFAVLFEAYPEARALLDYKRLQLHRFEPGADVFLGERLVTIADPARAPGRAIATARSGLVGPSELRALVRWRRDARHRSEADGPDLATADRLRAIGIPPRLQERLLRPLLAGILLDPELRSSGLLADQAFAMLAAGPTSVPGGGIGAIADQLAARLPGRVRLGARVERLHDGGVELAGGERLAAREVVVATEPAEAMRLSGAELPHEPRATTCLWFACERPPAGRRLLLDGTGEGPVTNAAVMSAVAPPYAPTGEHLLAASCVGLPHDGDDGALEHAVREQLARWFPAAAVASFRLLRTDRVRYAQHAQPPGAPASLPVRLRPGLLVAGDAVENASIDGALRSGRRAAEAIAAGT